MKTRFSNISKCQRTSSFALLLCHSFLSESAKVSNELFSQKVANKLCTTLSEKMKASWQRQSVGAHRCSSPQTWG